MNWSFPYAIGATGRTATAPTELYVRQLIEALLFTSPGERVRRPDLGTDLRRMVFAPNSPELAAALRHLVLGSLQQWLADVVQVEGVEVESEESTLTVTVRYRPLDSTETVTAVVRGEV